MPASKHAIGSDLAKVDAYENTAADYEEIPEITDEQFARSTVNIGGVPKMGRPTHGDRPKQQVTLRLNPSIIEHFRATGPGWQGRINDALAHVVAAKEAHQPAPVSDYPARQPSTRGIRAGSVRRKFPPAKD